MKLWVADLEALAFNYNVGVRGWLLVRKLWPWDHQGCLVAVDVYNIVTRKLAAYNCEWDALICYDNAPDASVTLGNQVACELWIFDVQLRETLRKDSCSFFAVEIREIPIKYFDLWVRGQEKEPWDYCWIGVNPSIFYCDVICFQIGFVELNSTSYTSGLVVSKIRIV